MVRTVVRSFLLTIIAGVAGLRLIFAYIDPNTGGMLFQILAVVFAFFSGFMLFFSRQIRTTLARVQRILRREQ
ncbi:MAG: hypothetical protein M5U01_18895 [Ardenticatenaceae bacterium]|nr:hypothetical protein [Ardenticatenaceae bacterium]HBY94945.1 hypothetical protein [Chloroflexota bacterium]